MFKIASPQGAAYDADLKLLLASFGRAWFLDSVHCAVVIASTTVCNKNK